MEEVRDHGIDAYEALVLPHGRLATVGKLEAEVMQLSVEQQETIRRCVIFAIDDALHSFLFKLQEIADYRGDSTSLPDMQFLVNREDIATLSDGLHGEAYGSDGWIAKYSKYKHHYYR
jgi:hypothetical protein